MEPIRVFVGCSANGEDVESQAVLEYTLKRNTNRPVEITWMKMSRDPSSFWFTEPNVDGAWQTNTWATPFSGFRWGIPAACNYEGQAIYMDSDMIIQADIGQLWDQPFQDGKMIMAKGGGESWRYCVAKWDCAAARKVGILGNINFLRRTPEAHQNLMAYFGGNKQIVQPFDGNWNCIDGEDYESLSNPEIKIIHYSDMGTQPHLKYAIPRLQAAGLKHWFDGTIRQHWRQDLIELFDRHLSDARLAGYTPESYIPETLYGQYNKQSQAGYISGHQWSKS